MLTPPPLPPFLNDLRDQFLARAAPPAWLVEDVQNRVVLFLNHVLMNEPQARERLARQAGRVVLMQWTGMAIGLLATPAGLLSLADAGRAADLTLTLTDTSPLELARHALQGSKPAVRIEGDVQLAAEVNWLIDHVRWDAEEDLARFLGNGPAHAISLAAGRALQMLRSLQPTEAQANAGQSSTPSPTPTAPPAPGA
ncbi:MAG: SCP2 sterol-binding domain-containing protein [Burkholderiaceae bacterium]